jgi:hypothetical protein
MLRMSATPLETSFKTEQEALSYAAESRAMMDKFRNERALAATQKALAAKQK